MIINETARTALTPAPARTAIAPQGAPAEPRETFTPGAAAASDAPAPPRKWTVMIYSAADNNLKSFMYGDLDESEQVGSDANTAVIAQYDGGSSEGCSRLYITKDSQSGKLNSPVIENMGKRVDMASAQTLSDFVQWGMKSYPAENYFLIISDHGNGWRGCVEDGSAGTWMSLPTVQEGLADAQRATGKKLDILGFDACLMASTEVAHQLKDQASFLVASEETEGAAGWPYPRVLTAETLGEMQSLLAQRIDLSPRDLAAHVVTSASSMPQDLPTMSAIDMEKVPVLTDAVDSFGKAILDSTMSMRALRRLARSAQGFADYRDLYDFADRVTKSDTVPDAALKAAAENVKKAVGEVVFAEQHSARYPNAHGITIEIKNVPRGYTDVAFAKDTSWDDALRKLNKFWGAKDA